MAESTTSKRTARATGAAAKRAARPAAAKSRTAAAEAAVSGATAGSRYLTTVVEHAVEQVEEWEAANRSLVEEIGALQRKAAGQLPQATPFEVLATDPLTDVAGLLEAQQAYVDGISTAAEAYRTGYEQAIVDYTKRAEALWEGSRRRAAADLADYVDDLRKELSASASDADPGALANLGVALIAMSQLTAAVPRD